MKDLNKIKKVATLAARKSGKMLLPRFNNFDRNRVKLKAHQEILTQADLDSNKIIIREIKKAFPKHRILSEETGKSPLAKGGKKSDYLWIIDPIDGTTNFSMHNPLFAISIGVAFKNKIVLGIIYAPVLDELYIASKGKGARLNNKKLKVSTQTKKALHAFCHGSEDKHKMEALNYYRRQKMKAIDCRQLGSASLELAYVASGRLESIMIPGVHSWDVAAGALLVREAGGRVTDFKNKEWNLKSHDILASNKKVHKSVLKVINS